jgi:pimeloyl-ACP methyl ester carboxylesterase
MSKKISTKGIMTTVFLHGLDSSSKGTKARWFKEHFPTMVIPDFTGTLDERMAKLNTILAGMEKVVLIGSSFGGLMATIYALENENRVKKVVLLAPALNFPDFVLHPGRKTAVSAQLYIGRQDTVCPPDRVLPTAQQIFADLSVTMTNDDHLLRETFTAIDWEELLKD